MAEESEMKEEERKDAEGGDKLDKVLSHLDSISKRMDAMEEADKAKADSSEDKEERDDAEDEEDGEERDDAEDEEEEGKPEPVVADKAKRKDAKRKDAEEEDGEEERKDAKAVADAVSSVADRIARVEAALPKRLDDADYAAMAESQAKADSVFHAFGDAAPRPLDGETPMAYRRRLAMKLQPHSAAWKTAKLTAVDDSTFEIIESQVYADALATAMSPATATPGVLRPVTRVVGGHTITDYVGEPRAWMDPMAGGNRQFVTSIAVPTMRSI